LRFGQIGQDYTRDSRHNCRAKIISASMNKPFSAVLSVRTTIAVVLLVSLGSVLPLRATAQTFNDVAADYWAYSFIETLVGNGVTAGCGNDIYCPEDVVTRAQMAVFLERGMNGSSFSPPAATGNVFLDVGPSDFAASFIEQLALDGITAGCGNNNYCPNTTVTRDQMAVFLLRSKYGAFHSPPAATGVFSDVPTNHWSAAWIEQLAAEGITAGCGNGNYCPDNPVTRAQMAVFLVRTFGLIAPPQDSDNDNVADSVDNCINVPNGPNEPDPDGNQADLDGDGQGNSCDSDMDGDSLLNDNEALIGTDPRNFDTDGDGATDSIDACPLDPNETRDTDNDGICDRSEFGVSIDEIKVSPYALWDDEVGVNEVTVTTYAASGNDFTLKACYVDDLPGSLGGYFEEAMYNDGTHGDAVEDDDYWSLTFVPQNSKPTSLRLFNGKVDNIYLSICVYDANGDQIGTDNPIDLHAEIGIVSHSETASAVQVAENMVATDAMVNIVSSDPVEQFGQHVQNVAKLFFETYPNDQFDFLVIFDTKSSGDAVPRSRAVSNSTVGLGAIPLFDNTSEFGATDVLKTVVHQNNRVVGSVINHELGHHWGVFYRDDQLYLESVLEPAHWGISTHIGVMGPGPFLKDDGNGGFLVTYANNNSGTPFSNNFSLLELYMMGLATRNEVMPLRFMADASYPDLDTIVPESSTILVSIDDIIAAYGERIPRAADSQKSFTAAFIVVSESFISEVEYTLTSVVARHFGSTAEVVFHDNQDSPSFSAATEFRATLETALPAVGQQ